MLDNAIEVAVATAVDVADVAPVPSWSIPSPFPVLPLLPGPVFENPLSFSVVNRAVGLKRRSKLPATTKVLLPVALVLVGASVVVAAGGACDECGKAVAKVAVAT